MFCLNSYFYIHPESLKNVGAAIDFSNISKFTLRFVQLEHVGQLVIL